MKLSNTQREVLKWMVNGWEAHQVYGDVIHINGKRICNFATINVLERMGLIVKSERYIWKATTEAKVALEAG